MSDAFDAHDMHDTDATGGGALAAMDEAEARRICRALLCDERPSAARLRDPGIAQMVSQRLDAVGFRWAVVDGRAYAVSQVDALDTDQGMAYTEPQLAAIARLAIELVAAPEPREGRRAALGVDAFHQTFAPEQRWSKAWLRRAVLGPLERDGYIRVVAPGQRRSDAFIEAGPRLRMIDTRQIARALEDAAG